MTTIERKHVRVCLSIAMVVTAIGLGVNGTAVAQRVTTRGEPQTLLFVQTTPKGAEVRLEGGEVLGKSDSLFVVNPGTYKIVVDLSGHPPQEKQVTIRKGKVARIELTFDGESSQQASSRRMPPRVVATIPKAGATDVDPDLKFITVAFDQDMGGGFSFTGGPPDFPPVRKGQRPVWKDSRTCELPIVLDKGKYYRVGINSTSYQNFRSAAGIPAPPSAIFFTTKGASEDLKNQVRIPHIVSMTPENGATDVDPMLSELRVTFNMPMGGGFSWTGGGPRFPQIPSGGKPVWTDGGTTCVLPVQLKANWDYVLGLNSVSHKNFQSKWGVPMEPVVYQFSTKAE